MVTGIVILAPLSSPITVKVVLNVVLLPNKVFTVVAVKLIWVPITVLETLVPNVVVELALVAASVLIPTPLKVFNSLTSAIVAEYPLVSNPWLPPW